MVQIEPFHIDQWITSHSEGTKHNLANSTAPPISVRDLESLHQNAPGGHNALTSVLSKPMEYGNALDKLSLLRKNIAAVYSHGSPHPVDVENIITTPGASLANFMVFYALVGPQDHVIVHYPTYQQFLGIPPSLGAEVSLWRTRADNGWQLEISELEKLIRPNTKMIVVNTPQNPTGAVTPKSTLEQLVKIASERDIILLSDEIYSPIFHSAPSGDSGAPPSMLSFGYKNTVVTGSLSKSYSLPGIRVGWLASHSPSIIKACNNTRSYCFMSISQIDEQVAAFALEPSYAQTITQRNTALAEHNVTIVQTFIDQHSSICSWVKPNGASIGFVRFSRQGEPVDDLALCLQLLETRKLLLVPGKKCFGQDKDFAGYVRLGFGIDTAVLKAALQALSDFIENDFDKVPLAKETEQLYNSSRGLSGQLHCYEHVSTSLRGVRQ